MPSRGPSLRPLATALLLLAAVAAAQDQPGPVLREIRLVGDPAWRHAGQITSIAAIDHDRILTTARDGTARIWDARTGAERRRFTQSSGDDVWNARLLPGGRQLLMCGEAGQLTLRNVDDGSVAQTFDQKGTLFRIAVSPDGLNAFVCDTNKLVVMWDLKTGEKVRTFRGNKESVYGVALSPDGKTLATGGADKTVRLWDVTTGEQTIEIAGHTGDVFTVAFAPDGRSVYSVSEDSTLRRWKLDGTEIWQRRLSDAGRTVDISPDGGRVVTLTDDKDLVVLDAESGEIIARLPTPITGWPACFSADGGLVYAGLGGTLTSWNIDEAAMLAPRPLYGGDLPVLGAIDALAMTADGRRLALGDDAERLHLLDLEHDTVVHAESLPGKPQWIDIAADQQTVLVGYREGARLIRTADGETFQHLQSPEGSVSQWFWADGGNVVVAAGDTRAQRFRRDDDFTGSEVRWPGRDGSHDWLAAHPTGESGAVEWNNRFARFVDLRDGSELGELDVGRSVRQLRFAGGGQVPLVVDDQNNLHQFGRPPEPIDTDVTDARLLQWVGELADDRYAVREHATAALIAAGDDAEPALAHADADDPEVAMRLDRIRRGATLRRLSPAEVGKPIALGRYVRDLAVCPDGMTWAATITGNGDHRIVVGRVTRNGLVQVAETHSEHGAERLFFARDGEHLLTGNGNGTVSIYQLPDSPPGP